MPQLCQCNVIALLKQSFPTFFSLPAQFNDRLIQRQVSMDVSSSLFVVFVA